MSGAVAENRTAEGRFSGGAELRLAWEALKQEKQGIRAHDAAATLGVSEGELIASLVGVSATRLRSDGANIIKDIPALGPVMALTRNDHVVHEKIGPYLDVSIESVHGLVLGELIDLRLFPSHWRYAFAVIDETKDGPRRSIQIFDRSGTAVHKIFQKPQTNTAAFDELIRKWTAPEQDAFIAVEAPAAAREDLPDSEIDVDALREKWLAMKDTHEFFGMLRSLNLGRLQAMRHAGRDLAVQVKNDSLSLALEMARDSGTPIMVFVGNPGCIQIHSGPVSNLKRMGPWFNVLDPDFNLHLREDAIDTAWVVRKPTEDGIVTSLELYNKDGFCFAQLFGARKPGKPELQGWCEIAAALPTLDDTLQ